MKCRERFGGWIGVELKKCGDMKKYDGHNFVSKLVGFELD